MKVAYLGPAGTFSEEALRLAAAGVAFEPLPVATIHAAVEAVEGGDAERALVPFENSIEGTVRPTLDALAFDTDRVRIVGEFDHQVHQMLIAARPLELGAIERVLSHPQATAQCARFLRTELAGRDGRDGQLDLGGGPAGRRRRRRALGGARIGRGRRRPTAASSSARTSRTRADNVTRFVWLADVGAEPPAVDEARPWRTTLVFDELGADHPGALVDALSVLSDRGINMTRIESRPRRSGLGTYLFFLDLDGRAGDGRRRRRDRGARRARRDRPGARQLPGRRRAAAARPSGLGRGGKHRPRSAHVRRSAPVR